MISRETVPSLELSERKRSHHVINNKIKKNAQNRCGPGHSLVRVYIYARPQIEMQTLGKVRI